MCVTRSSGRHTATPMSQAPICTRTAVLSYVWEWCVSSRIVHKHWQQSFILPDQMMRVPHTDTHTGFVLCDQMMRVAMMLVTSIQQCPILFGSHPYCVTVLWCFVSTFPQSVSVTLHCSQWNIDVATPFMSGKSSLTRKCWGGNHGEEIIIHFSCF